MILFLKGLDLPLSLFSLADPDLMGVLSVFEVFGVVVVLDDLCLNILLGVTILSLILLIEEA